MYTTQFQERSPMRLDKFLAHSISELSREQIKGLIEEGYVLINKESVTKKTVFVALGDVVQVDVAAWKAAQFKHQQPVVNSVLADRVRIVAEYPDFLVVDKPAGLLVHRTNAPGSYSLVEVLKERYPEIDGVQDAIENRNDGNLQDRSGIVHRIDRDTSGLIIVARNFDGFYWFKSAFQNRNIVKKYQCLVQGNVTEEMGEITFPITRSKLDHSKRVAIMNASDQEFYEKKRSALTEYIVKERFAETTLLEVYLHTGRTHQIRVHMKAIDHPIIGDPHYGILGTATEPPLRRQFLHATHLSFDYQGQHISIDSELAPELREYLEVIA